MSGFAPLYDTDTGRSSAWAATGNAAHVVSANITTEFRDSFDSYVPNSGNWAEVKGSGDLIYVDGNTASASYLVISKDPLRAGTESRITSTATFMLPIEASIGLSLSQRTLGQEFSVEFIDTQDPFAALSDLEISSITQSTTTLTITTVLNNNMTVGMCFGIRDCSNQLANYPALVVASVISPTQFTATAGPGGTIPSQTITNPAGAKGFIYFRERLGRAQNGISEIFENVTVSNASFYIRSKSSDVLPSGTVAGNHSTSISTSASTSIVSGAYAYAFSPSTEFKYLIQTDRAQWADVTVDSLSQATSRLVRTQVCLDPKVSYKLRFRCVNNKSLTVPNAQIVSAAKTGTTTATVITDVPHGLTTGDQIVAYGTRDQTNFANLATATAVTVVDSTTFTITWGAAVTSTTYGGYIAKVQGGNLMSALGAIAQTAQAAVLTTLSDGTRQLTLTGSAAWAGLTIGDLVNIIGVRDNITGVSIGVDGAWKVANFSTTTLVLVLPYANSMSLPADFASVNCGGGVVKRTDLRISFVRVTDYERERVEMISRPASDMAAAAPVVVQGGSITATVSNGYVEGTQAWNSTTVPNPVLMSVFSTTTPVASSSGRQQRVLGTLHGALVSKPYSVPENDWLYAAALGGILNTTTAVTIKSAAGANLRNYITNIQIMSDALTNATEIAVRDGASGTVLWRVKIPTSGISLSEFNFSCPIRGSSNTLLEVVTLTASGTGAVYFNAQGFSAP